MAKDCRSCKEVAELKKALAETERKWREEKARADSVEEVNGRPTMVSGKG